MSGRLRFVESLKFLLTIHSIVAWAPNIQGCFLITLHFGFLYESISFVGLCNSHEEQVSVRPN